MIERELLLTLGWSEELIAAVSRRAEPMRDVSDSIKNIETNEMRVSSISSSVLLAESAVLNTGQEYRIPAQQSNAADQSIANDKK